MNDLTARHISYLETKANILTKHYRTWHVVVNSPATKDVICALIRNSVIEIVNVRTIKQNDYGEWDGIYSVSITDYGLDCLSMLAV